MPSDWGAVPEIVAGYLRLLRFDSVAKVIDWYLHGELLSYIGGDAAKTFPVKIQRQQDIVSLSAKPYRNGAVFGTLLLGSFDPRITYRLAANPFYQVQFILVHGPEA